MSWTDRAACRGEDVDLFFPRRGASSTPARTVCERCDVRGDCLEYALAAPCLYGVWGGMTEADRKRLRRTRRQS